jgi:negative regulator of sigma-B (phosphoserine phosphatase)
MGALSEAEVVPEPPRWIEWGVAGQALGKGEPSGDRFSIREFAGGVLLGVVDGLGHGPEAAAAAAIAVDTLEHHPEEPVVPLVRRCHEALRGTRGVALSIASIDAVDHTMNWLAVGNVEAVLVRGGRGVASGSERILLRGGVIGYQLPLLRASITPVRAGDMLVFATDGIRSEFAQALNPLDQPLQAAERILAEYGKDSDDALVLVARYLGGSA